MFSRSWTGEWTGCDACESILNQYFPHEEKKEKKRKDWLVGSKSRSAGPGVWIPAVQNCRKKLTGMSRGDEGMVGITQLAVIHWCASRGRCGTKSAQSSLPIPHPPKLTPPQHTHTPSSPNFVLKCICCLSHHVWRSLTSV